MFLHVDLEHPITKHRAFFDVFGINANGVAQVAQNQGPSGLNALAEALLKAKLPTHLYPYDIVDTEFRDNIDVNPRYVEVAA